MRSNVEMDAVEHSSYQFDQCFFTKTLSLGCPGEGELFTPPLIDEPVDEPVDEPDSINRDEGHGYRHDLCMTFDSSQISRLCLSLNSTER